MTTSLSIVIITHNEAAILRRCLDSLHELLAQPIVQVIVVDNGSTDGTLQMLSTDFPSVETLALPRNTGVAFARNRGLEKAVGEKILILDNDTVASAHAIQTMIQHLDLHPQCGICACALVDEQGTVQDSHKPYPGLREKLRNIIGRNPAINHDNKVYVIGACQMFRSALLSEIGMLDQRMFYGPEDADFCLRAQAAGYSIDYLPQVKITHLWRRASHRIFSSLAIKHLFALIYFWKKHRRWL